MLAIIAAIENDIEREFITGIYKKYYGVMLKKAESILKNREDAEEAVQEAFVSLIDKVSAFMQVSPEKQPAYAVATAKNIALTKLRKSKKLDSKTVSIDDDDSYLELPDNAIPEELYIEKEKVNALAEILSKLPEKYKTVLECKYILEMTDEEIGKELRLTAGSVRSCLTRARRKAYILMKGEA